MKLAKSTKEFLASIRKLDKGVLKECETFPRICIRYYKDITPDTYQASGYKSADANYNDIVENISNTSDKNMMLGLIETGYHTLKCRYIFPEEMAHQSSIAESIESDKTNVGSIHVGKPEEALDMVPISQSSPRLNAASNLNDFLNINCFCLVNEVLKSITFVECTKCSKLEHLPCAGYLYLRDVETPYYCELCRYFTSMSSTPDDINRRRKTCVYRLILSYMFFNQVFPNELFENINIQKYRKVIVQFCRMYGIIKEVQNEITVNMRVLSGSINILMGVCHFTAKKTVGPKKDEECTTPSKKMKALE